ncbi:hypothetical protein PanWU01x14_013580 [Parasponia andersonii]|uniref:Uncharacterized protein n=1 Tax=Parasponia andersonii TaxID=3476 RepID=A0A2P5E142_PARAD|nr:hypothetical protein PanWU01x14_013580 [Parasponia andersonii]
MAIAGIFPFGAVYFELLYVIVSRFNLFFAVAQLDCVFMAIAYITTMPNQIGLVPCKSPPFSDTWLASAMAFS